METHLRAVGSTDFVAMDFNPLSNGNTFESVGSTEFIYFVLNSENIIFHFHQRIEIRCYTIGRAYGSLKLYKNRITAFTEFRKNSKLQPFSFSSHHFFNYITNCSFSSIFRRNIIGNFQNFIARISGTSGK
jgi:hypothetical protein